MHAAQVLFEVAARRELPEVQDACAGEMGSAGDLLGDGGGDEPQQ